MPITSNRTDPWPDSLRHIPEDAGREVLAAMERLSYHNACDTNAELDLARKAAEDLGHAAVKHRMHPGHVSQLAQAHGGLVSEQSALFAVIRAAYAQLNRVESILDQHREGLL